MLDSSVGRLSETPRKGDPPVFLERAGGPRDLHSSPTRRSSDLIACRCTCAGRPPARRRPGSIRTGGTTRATRTLRSEEHTSELQSRQYLVCRLPLEKKTAPREENRRAPSSPNATRIQFPDCGCT